MVRAVPLRFAVGARVECAVAEDTWQTGVVVAHWYVLNVEECRENARLKGVEIDEPNLGPLPAVPYQMRLDTGHLIYAEHDGEWAGTSHRRRTNSTPRANNPIALSDERVIRARRRGGGGRGAKAKGKKGGGGGGEGKPKAKGKGKKGRNK